jgi:hypothetical protein
MALIAMSLNARVRSGEAVVIAVIGTESFRFEGDDRQHRIFPKTAAKTRL